MKSLKPRACRCQFFLPRFCKYNPVWLLFCVLVMIHFVFCGLCLLITPPPPLLLLALNMPRMLVAVVYALFGSHQCGERSYIKDVAQHSWLSYQLHIIARCPVLPDLCQCRQPNICPLRVFRRCRGQAFCQGGWVRASRRLIYYDLQCNCTKFYHCPASEAPRLSTVKAVARKHPTTEWAKLVTAILPRPCYIPWEAVDNKVV